MLLKISFLLPHLFCNVEIDFTWFHNNQTVVQDFNSQNRNARVSKQEEYWNYWVLINTFWIRLDFSDKGTWDIDLSDTDLDLLDKDIPNNHFVCLLDVFKTSARHVFKTSSRRLQRNNFSSSQTSSRYICKMSSRPTNVCWVITLCKVKLWFLQNSEKNYMWYYFLD